MGNVNNLRKWQQNKNWFSTGIERYNLHNLLSTYVLVYRTSVQDIDSVIIILRLYVCKKKNQKSVEKSSTKQLPVFPPS
jgi:hypothetical protein